MKETPHFSAIEISLTSPDHWTYLVKEKKIKSCKKSAFIHFSSFTLPHPSYPSYIDKKKSEKDERHELSFPLASSQICMDDRIIFL